MGLFVWPLGDDQEYGVPPLFPADFACRRESRRAESGLNEHRGQSIAVKTMVKDTLRTGRVKSSVFAVEVGQRDPASRWQMRKKRGEQSGRVFDVVQGHGAHNEVDGSAEWLAQDVLAIDLDSALKRLFGREFFEHGRRYVDRQESADLGCNFGCHKTRAGAEVHDGVRWVEGDMGLEGSKNAL